jgi:hypothetical protein
MSNLVPAEFGYNTLTLIMCAPPFLQKAYQSECGDYELQGGHCVEVKGYRQAKILQMKGFL